MRRRLRDLTAESEAELKRKVESMEKELDLSADLQCAFTPPRLVNPRHPNKD